MVRCRDCSAEWTALTWAHCAGCHETFTGVTYFDEHRHLGACWYNDPPSVVPRGSVTAVATSKMPVWSFLRKVDGVWSTPEGHLNRKRNRDLAQKLNDRSR